MGLLRGVARTAVIAGTATAVSNRVSRRQAGRWADQEQKQADEQYAAQQQAAAQYAAQQQQQQPAAMSMDDKLAQLHKLAELKDKGVLTDEEFQQQKNKIMNS